MPYTLHFPAALDWLAIRRPKPWARVPGRETDIAAIIAERRQRVAIETDRQAREDRKRFTAAVTAEVERRLAGP